MTSFDGNVSCPCLLHGWYSRLATAEPALRGACQILFKIMGVHCYRNMCTLMGLIGGAKLYNFQINKGRTNKFFTLHGSKYVLNYEEMTRTQCNTCVKHKDWKPETFLMKCFTLTNMLCP